ncbi:MAG: hypothetical protein N3B12_03405, partial [Armatimonadetes bacterium]|nr:hypothetical protein [Armatimonadota bacterium]
QYTEIAEAISSIIFCSKRGSASVKMSQKQLPSTFYSYIKPLANIRQGYNTRKSTKEKGI